MRSCTVCLLPELTAVNRALMRGSPGLAELGRKHHVSPQALTRHKAHLPPAQVEAQSVAAGDHGSALVAELRALQLTLSDLLGMARSQGDFRGATAVVRECSRVVEMIGRMEGALTPPPAIQVNLHQSVEYQVVIGKVIEALQGWPEAKQRVADALLVH
jgi:hypothetical protein